MNETDSQKQHRTYDSSEKASISRRKLLGGIGKLAYIAPTLTLLSLFANNTHANGPPCGPNESPPDCTPTFVPTSSKQKSFTKGRRKHREK